MVGEVGHVAFDDLNLRCRVVAALLVQSRLGHAAVDRDGPARGPPAVVSTTDVVEVSGGFGEPSHEEAMRERRSPIGQQHDRPVQRRDERDEESLDGPSGNVFQLSVEATSPIRPANASALTNSSCGG
jgi:hypothetical protein